MKIHRAALRHPRDKKKQKLWMFLQIRREAKEKKRKKKNLNEKKLADKNNFLFWAKQLSLWEIVANWEKEKMDARELEREWNFKMQKESRHKIDGEC